MEIKTSYICKSLMLLTAILVCLTTTSSCHKRIGPTAIQIEDSIRHYPSITLGDELELVYVVKNIGKEILILKEVQPSCPAIEPSPANVSSITPGEEAVMKFTFHSDKNIALARHSIRLFGNIAPKGVAEIIFDTHVVRPSVDLSDYEEHYQRNIRSEEEQYLDGNNNEKGYVTE